MNHFNYGIIIGAIESAPLLGAYERRAEPMDVIGVIIGILSLCGTFFAIGYQIGKDSNKTQK